MQDNTITSVDQKLIKATNFPTRNDWAKTELNVGVQCIQEKLSITFSGFATDGITLTADQPRRQLRMTTISVRNS
jgi:hypothetical protein